MLTIAICDDDKHFAEKLESRIVRLSAMKIPERIEVLILPPFSQAKHVLDYLSKESIDIIFLDIVMPIMSGFELASELKQASPDTLIVFVSEHDEKVFEAFQYEPFRFQRKSHFEEEFAKTFSETVEKYLTDNELFSFNASSGMATVKVKDILYFEGEKNYFLLHTVSGKVYRCRGTLSSIEEKICEYDFFRIHSAFIANLEHIDRINTNSSLSLKNGQILNVSRRKEKELKSLHARFLSRRYAK